MKNVKIYVAGHRGMVGSAIVRALRARGVRDEDLLLRSHDELDLTRQEAVEAFLQTHKPTQIYLAAAKVGGIHANNSFPAEFIHRNLMIQCNVVEAAFRAGTRQLLLLGSSCIYPRAAAQPMAEDALLTGVLEPTNEPYAIAKIAGIKLCESYNRQYGESHGIDFRSVMPTNLYGPGDNYHPENSHVIPGLLRRFHEARLAGAPTVTLWGTGTPLREFLYVDDMAEACLHVMNLPRDVYASVTHPMLGHLNVGSGSEVTIRQLAELVAEAVGYTGTLVQDTTKPDGTPRKLMDSGRLNALGWHARIDLKEGLALAYQDFMETHA